MMLGIVFLSACLLVFVVVTVIHEKIEKAVNKRTEVAHNWKIWSMK